MKKSEASYIWHCIGNHDGFAEDRGEWAFGCGIDDDDLEEFCTFIEDEIDQLPEGDA